MPWPGSRIENGRGSQMSASQRVKLPDNVEPGELWPPYDSPQCDSKPSADSNGGLVCLQLGTGVWLSYFSLV